jgi:secreted trypsin-like serine protease
VRIKAGSTTHKVGGTWAAVDKIIVHDQYNAKTNEHDLALVKLKARSAGQAIPLAQPQQALKQCELLEITGWGHTKESGVTSDTLQKALVPYVDNATCNEPNSYAGAIRSGMMCAGLREGGVDSCQGDSGGPLVLRGQDGPVLVGIVSWGDGCARKLKYGVYTRVMPYREWITRVIAAETK